LKSLKISVDKIVLAKTASYGELEGEGERRGGGEEEEDHE
jgi:hypothetical protein